MKKQKKQLLFLSVLLILMILALAATGFLSDEEEEEEIISYEVISLESAEVMGFSFTNSSGTFSFAKAGETWNYEADASFAVDSEELETQIGKIAQYQSENRIEAVTDVSVYGLDEPQITITLTTADDTVTIYIGDYNSTSEVYYMCLADDMSTVYSVKSATITAYKGTADDFAAETDTTESAEP